MSCCCPHAQSAGRLFSFFAARYRKRFERKGFEPPQKQLFAGIKQAGFQDSSILEIGCGVGYFHQTLLENGAASAVGVELAANMIAQAKDRAKQINISDRTAYLQGDFISLADEIMPADLTLLDKVICCYPDADTLVHKSLQKTQRVYAVIYPRDRLLTKVGVSIGAFLMRLVCSDFRPYVHDPKKIEQWVSEAGFEKVYENTTAVWLAQVYKKPSDKG